MRRLGDRIDAGFVPDGQIPGCVTVGGVSLHAAVAHGPLSRHPRTCRRQTSRSRSGVSRHLTRWDFTRKATLEFRRADGERPRWHSRRVSAFGETALDAVAGQGLRSRRSHLPPLRQFNAYHRRNPLASGHPRDPRLSRPSNTSPAGGATVARPSAATRYVGTCTTQSTTAAAPRDECARRGIRNRAGRGPASRQRRTQLESPRAPG